MNYEDALKSYVDAVRAERTALRILNAAAQQEGFDIGKTSHDIFLAVRRMINTEGV